MSNAKRLLLGLTCATAASLSALQPAAAQTSSAGSPLPSRGMLERLGLERLWWNQAVHDPSRDRIRYLTNDEDLVYAQSSSGTVTAFDAETGRNRWAVQLGFRDQPSWQLTSNEELAFVVAGTTLFAVNKWNGDIVWEVAVPGAPSAGPQADDENVYIGMIDGSVFALDLARIADLWEQGLLPSWSQNVVKWRYKTPNEIRTPPVSTGFVVLAASRSGSRTGTIYSISRERRTLRFQFETDSPLSAPLTAAPEAHSQAGDDEQTWFVYAASEDFFVYCINALTGAIRWEFVAGTPVKLAPRIVGPHIFLFPSRGGMFCLARTTGRERWWQPEVSQFLSATQSRVYASDELGELVVLSREDGALLGAMPLRQFDLRLANTVTDRIVVATTTGLVVSLGERGQEFPVYHKHPEQRPILPEIAPESAPGTQPADTAEPPIPPSDGAANP